MVCNVALPVDPSEIIEILANPSPLSPRAYVLFFIAGVSHDSDEHFILVTGHQRAGAIEVAEERRKVHRRRRVRGGANGIPVRVFCKDLAYGAAFPHHWQLLVFLRHYSLILLKRTHRHLYFAMSKRYRR